MTDITKETANTVGGELVKEGVAISDYVKKVLMENAEVIEQIRQCYKEGELTEAELEEELEDQKKVMKKQLLAQKTAEKVVLQRALDGALNLVKKAIIA